MKIIKLNIKTNTEINRNNGAILAFNNKLKLNENPNKPKIISPINPINLSIITEAETLERLIVLLFVSADFDKLNILTKSPAIPPGR